jgi:hypothetical protein
VVAAWFYSRLGPSGFKEWKYNPLCHANEESISNMLNEELDIGFDELDLEIEAETAIEESSNEVSESESESETSVVHGKT